MASEKIQGIMGHALRAEQSFHQTTGNLDETQSQLHGWNDKVGDKARASYDRILNEWKSRGRADIQALKNTARRLDFDAGEAQIIDQELKELAHYLSGIEEEVNHG